MVHYKKEAPKGEKYSVERFRSRTTGLFFALEQRLKETGDYLVGNKLYVLPSHILKPVLTMNTVQLQILRRSRLWLLRKRLGLVLRYSRLLRRGITESFRGQE